MDQLIQAFGIDIRLIITQIINFVLLLGVLSYFLYKPLLKMLATREEKIAKGIVDAEAAAQAKAQADAEKAVVLSAAHHSAEEIATRAKQFADEKSAGIVGVANTKAESIIKEAENKGEDIKTQAKKDSEAEIAKVAVLAAEKIMRSS